MHGCISAYGSLAMIRQIEIETRVPGGSGEAGHQKAYCGETPCLFDTLTLQREDVVMVHVDIVKLGKMVEKFVTSWTSRNGGDSVRLRGAGRRCVA